MLARHAENSTSGRVSFWERSQLSCWSSTSACRNVTGLVPENVRYCGFKRSSTNLDRAPKMQDSVLLSSSDSFFSDSALNLFKNLCHKLLSESRSRWLFLGNSCVSFAKAANFRLFLNVAIFAKRLKSREDGINCIL